MKSVSIDIIWRIAEAEAAYAGFPAITPAHLWISHCKAVDLSVSDVLGHGDDELRAMEGQVETDFRELREAIRAAGLSAKLLRRAIRVELGRGPGAGARPLHRSDTLRAVFKRGAALATEDGGRLRPLHLLIALAEQNEPAVASAIVKLGHDAADVMRALSARPGKAARKKPEQRREDGKPLGKKESALQRFGRDLTELAAQGALPPLIGRREEMLRITQILMQSRKNNLILVGEPGVGKTGIVEGFAQLLADGKLPSDLGKPAVIEISLSSLVAGTKYRGEFEERLEALVKEASLDPKPILFIDEIHLLLGAGSASGSMDAANILKPALARGAIRVIGATTTNEYRQTIEKDGALERRFQMLRVEEPSADEAVAILLALRPRLEAHHGVALDEAALRAAVEWSVRYLPDFRLPDKALDLVDQSCAVVRFATLTPRGDEGDRMSPRRTGTSSPSYGVGVDDIARVVAARCGIPVGTLTADEGARLMALEGELGERVKGQGEAVAAVAEALRLARAGLKKPNRPAGVFLFVGPSGTGKTELAKALAEQLFHDESRLIRFDMSEFMEEHSVSKLIGSPPGYVGHDEGGQLSDAIRTHPYSVVLFDEIEKAHPKVLDLFLQIFDDGVLTDAQGRKCDFSQSIILMTSNLGTGERKRRMGFGAAEDEDVGGTPTLLEAVRRHFRPELVNRLTGIVPFTPIGMETAREIVGKLIGEWNTRLARRGVTLEFSEAAVDLLLREGFSEQYGARNLERTMDRLLGKKLADLLLSGGAAVGNMLRVDVDQGKISIAAILEKPA